ncbi:MAG: hypothetical protein H6Q82_2330, partial [Deltaproteobacteria bacterium]|nr:hypothetical protein [Deltaproteobacteria bacterium]
MRKGWLVFLVVALVVVLAAPASAEFKLNGFYRVVPEISNYYGGAGNTQLNVPGTQAPAVNSLVKDATSVGVNTNSSRPVTQMRNRLRFEVGDENVKGVTFFEIDGSFGDSGGAVGRNQGFASNGDSINLETKNVYLWFKVPNTPVDFTVGLQGFSDEFAGLFFSNSDQAGVVMNVKAEPVTVRATWLKLRQVTTASTPTNNAYTGVSGLDNSADFYGINAAFVPTKAATITGVFNFINDSGSFVAQPIEAINLRTMKAYFAGLNGTFNAGPAAVTGFFVYNWGTFENRFNPALATDKVDIEGYAGSLRVDANLGPGKGFLEGLYVSGDNDTADNKYKGIITGSDYANLTSWYGRPDLYILFPNFDMIQAATALVLNPNNDGRGLYMFAGGFTTKLGAKLTGKIGAGYLAAVEKRKTTATNEAKGTAMGTEINANVNYNIAKGLDFGLYGAYCF